MIIVVIDHCGIPLCPAIDCIEVPSFFIVSGYLYNRSTAIREILLSKTKRLIVPFLLYALIFIILVRPTGSFLHNMALPANEPLWFLKSLFWVHILAYAITHLSTYLTSIRTQLLAKQRYIEIVLSFIIAIPCIFYRSHLLTMIGLQQAILALPLFYAGHIFRYAPDIKRWMLPLIILLWIISARYNIGFNDSYIGPNPILFYLSSISAFISIYGLLSFIRRCPIVEYIGRQSIHVLGLHLIIIRLLKSII